MHRREARVLHSPPASLPASRVSELRADVRAALTLRYHLEGEIGHGGMATVYRAREGDHGPVVALKVLRPELALALGGERFTREIRITAALQHAHILPLLDSGDAAGVPYYVMPFVAGASLAHLLEREGPLPVADAVRICADIADGLAYAHRRGLIHRDIKPANILLDHGHALLADFGIARILDGSSEVLTDSGLALGTASYMSPEQAAGDRVDARADIYALGCVLYELLAGAPPFTGASQRDIMARHATDPVPSLRTVRPDVPKALERVILRSLEKDADRRFSHAGGFREAMLAAIASRASVTSPASPSAASAASTAASAEFSEGAGPSSAMISAVIATISVVLIGIALVLRSR